MVMGEYGWEVCAVGGGGVGGGGAHKWRWQDRQREWWGREREDNTFLHKDIRLNFKLKLAFFFLQICPRERERELTSPFPVNSHAIFCHVHEATDSASERETISRAYVAVGGYQN